jgi:hypothetical protein
VGGQFQCLFPRLSLPRKRFGLGLVLACAQREGGSARLRIARIEEAFETPGRRPKAAVLARADVRSLAGLLTGLAHADRLRVAAAVMTGANTHGLLRESLGLKTGPLYHHVRGLQRAGLLAQAGRNRYELTELGETTLLVATGLGHCLAAGRSGWRTRRCVLYK